MLLRIKGKTCITTRINVANVPFFFEQSGKALSESEAAQRIDNLMVQMWTNLVRPLLCSPTETHTYNTHKQSCCSLKHKKQQVLFCLSAAAHRWETKDRWTWKDHCIAVSNRGVYLCYKYAVKSACLSVSTHILLFPTNLFFLFLVCLPLKETTLPEDGGELPAARWCLCSPFLSKYHVLWKLRQRLRPLFV